MTVKAARNGHLTCDEHNAIWCKDIEGIVRAGSDSAELWAVHPDHQMIEVPIIPTANLWAQVGLVRGDDRKIKMYRVTFIRDDKPDNEEGIFIGFIHPPEARDILRSMILDWFIGTQEPNVENGCTAEGHGYKQTIRWHTDMGSRATAIPQLWSVWATGKCLGCTFNLAANPDLVPDAGPARTPWSP